MAPADGGQACRFAFDPTLALAPGASPVRIHEVVSSNDGVYVDELGETDDYVELENAGSTPISLAGHTLSDRNGNRASLPALILAPAEVILLWADGEPEQGMRHLPLKLDADGERITLWSNDCSPVERIEVPALSPNESFARVGDAFARCRYATPGQRNASCAPLAPPALPETVRFEPFAWPSDFPNAPELAINELDLRGSGAIELVNNTSAALELARFSVRVAAIAPDRANDPRASAPLAWPITTLASGARLVLSVPESARAELAAADYEGWVNVYDERGTRIDRAVFSSWPQGSLLARVPDGRGPLTFCRAATLGAENASCDAPATRTLSERAHALHTASDFSGLARGGTLLDQSAVKFVVDMHSDDLVHLLSSERFALHYTFVRERIYGQPPLDRCDPRQAAEFNAGWSQFGDEEYARVEPRRFLLGTLVRHAGGLRTLEFAAGDALSASQMRRAFLAVVAATDEPRAWSLRPAGQRVLVPGDTDQVTKMRMLEGTLPIVGPHAPFAGVSYQPLTGGETFGVLRFMAANELGDSALAPTTIVVTDDVPNEVPFLAGVITESFQTPLSHVNVLSQARGTPNMAVPHARTHARIAPLLGKIVRLTVGPDDFTLREASEAELAAFWEARRPKGPAIVPPLDLTRRGVTPLVGNGLETLPWLGAKAAQFGELYRIPRANEDCANFEVPARAFAIPIAHYSDHFVASGAAELLRLATERSAFRSDPAVRAEALSRVRSAMLAHPVAATLLTSVEAAVRSSFGKARVRFRSSSNVEDLPTFNGAGLHDSVSAELDDPDRSLANALRTVWASLWLLRAYDERENANIDHRAAGMAVLVHEAYAGELAQGVAISRDLLDLTRGDIYYINAQRGEATVTNPAPGVTTEQLLYTWPDGWEEAIRYRSRSSLSPDMPVLTEAQVVSVACALKAVHHHFQPRLDPTGADRKFAMQIEFKFEREGTLVVKQARPQPFGHVELPADCR